MYTVWNASKCGVFSGPYFLAFGLNTERYEVSLRIQSGCMKIRNTKNSVFGHFSRSDKLQKRFKTKNENIAKFKMRKSNFDNRNRSTNWNSTVGFTKSHFHNATKSICTYRKSWYHNNWFWYDKKAKYHYRISLQNFPLSFTFNKSEKKSRKTNPTKQHLPYTPIQNWTMQLYRVQVFYWKTPSNFKCSKKNNKRNLLNKSFIFFCLYLVKTTNTMILEKKHWKSGTLM